MNNPPKLYSRLDNWEPVSGTNVFKLLPILLIVLGLADYWVETNLCQNLFPSLLSYNECGALHDLVPFVQFKKHEKHP